MRDPRETLTPAAIAAKAIEIADAEGRDAITVRRVTSELGVTAMALYAHFPDKDALLDAAVDAILTQAEAPRDGGGTAREVLASSMRGFLRVLREHPAIALLIPERIGRVAAGERISEHVLELLAGVGHAPREAANAAHFVLTTLVAMVVGAPDCGVDEGEAYYERGVEFILHGIVPRRMRAR